MKMSIILFLLIILALFEQYLLIFNGKEFTTEDYPYIMVVRCKSESSNSLCTGSLISELFVLTAQRCTYGRTEKDVDVTQGAPYLRNEYHKVVKIHQHKTYDPKERNVGDICLLRIEFAFPRINTFLKLGGSPNDFDNLKTMSCQMFGFGYTGNEKTKLGTGFMMTGDVRYGKKACQAHNSKLIKDTWNQYLCLVPNQNSTTCESFDIGGPMICNGKQYGLNSFQFSYVKDGGLKCGDKDQQVVYVFIHYFKDWINNIIDPKKKDKKKKNKKKQSSGNLLKPHHTLHLIVSIILHNMLIFIQN